MTYEIQGLHTSGVWHPLYTGYSSDWKAKQIMGIILDQNPKECQEYEDFRVVEDDRDRKPARSTPPKARQTSQAARSSLPEGLTAAAVVRRSLRASDGSNTAPCAYCGSLVSFSRGVPMGHDMYRHENCGDAVPKKQGRRKKAVKL
jgi:hypothetical protein